MCSGGSGSSRMWTSGYEETKSERKWHAFYPRLKPTWPSEPMKQVVKIEPGLRAHIPASIFASFGCVKAQRQIQVAVPTQ